MENWIKPFIERSSSKNDGTHFYSPLNGYIKLESKDVGMFWDNYCDSVNNNQNPHLQENGFSWNQTKLGFDILIKFDRTNVTPQKKQVDNLLNEIDEYVEAIITSIQEMINNFFSISEAGHEYVALYMTSKDKNNLLVWDDNIVTFRGRIFFPYASIKKKYMNTFYYAVLTYIQTQLGLPRDFLSCDPINGYDTLLKLVDSEKVEMAMAIV